MQAISCGRTTERHCTLAQRNKILLGLSQPATEEHLQGYQAQQCWNQQPQIALKAAAAPSFFPFTECPTNQPLPSSIRVLRQRLMFQTQRRSGISYQTKTGEAQRHTNYTEIAISTLPYSQWKSEGPAHPILLFPQPPTKLKRKWKLASRDMLPLAMEISRGLCTGLRD